MSSRPRSVLFICTGNIFRSMVAEYALKAWLGSDASIVARSAGIHAMPQTVSPLIRDRLKAKGIDVSVHVQQRLSQALLEQVDIAIAMSLDHQAFVRRVFQRDVPLFNEFCFQRAEPILDIHEAILEWHRHPDAAQAYAEQVIQYIWDAMPVLLARVRGNEGR